MCKHCFFSPICYFCQSPELTQSPCPPPPSSSGSAAVVVVASLNHGTLPPIVPPGTTQRGTEAIMQLCASSTTVLGKYLPGTAPAQHLGHRHGVAIPMQGAM